MNEIGLFIAFVQDIGLIGVMTILAVPTLRKKIFGTDPYTEEIRDEVKAFGERLTQHLKDEEEEMKSIKDHMTKVESDMSYIRGKISK